VNAHNQTAGDQDSTLTVARLALWTAAWVATFAVASFGPEHLWDSDAASWVAVAVNLAVGIGWIAAHVRYLRGIDELQRRIMVDALAITLGAGFVGGFAYVVADAAGLIAFDDVGVLTILLTAFYLAAIAVGNYRYR
jgi:hypothetical protein